MSPGNRSNPKISTSWISSSEGVEGPGTPWREGCDPLTSAQGLCVIPVRVSHVDALNDGRALLQRVARVTGKLHYGPDVIGRVGRGEVPILNVGLVAVAFLKGWGQKTKEGSCSREPGEARRAVLTRARGGSRGCAHASQGRLTGLLLTRVRGGSRGWA